MQEYNDGSFGSPKPLTEEQRQMLEEIFPDLEKTRAIHLGKTVEELEERAKAMQRFFGHPAIKRDKKGGG